MLRQPQAEEMPFAAVKVERQGGFANVGGVVVVVVVVPVVGEPRGSWPGANGQRSLFAVTVRVDV